MLNTEKFDGYCAKKVNDFRWSCFDVFRLTADCWIMRCRQSTVPICGMWQRQANTWQQENKIHAHTRILKMDALRSLVHLRIELVLKRSFQSIQCLKLFMKKSNSNKLNVETLPTLIFVKIYSFCWFFLTFSILNQYSLYPAAFQSMLWMVLNLLIPC